jgi:hypothetical protein
LAGRRSFLDLENAMADDSFGSDPRFSPPLRGPIPALRPRQSEFDIELKGFRTTMRLVPKAKEDSDA